MVGLGGGNGTSGTVAHAWFNRESWVAQSGRGCAICAGIRGSLLARDRKNMEKRNNIGVPTFAIPNPISIYIFFKFYAPKKSGFWLSQHGFYFNLYSLHS